MEPAAKVLCLFSGRRRKNSVAGCLRQQAKQHGVHLEVLELDIRSNKNLDFTLNSVQKRWLQRIRAGEFFAVVSTPPCSTFSRAPWANEQGAYPVRSQRYPRGFPWNGLGRRQKAELGNILADFSFEALKQQSKQTPGVYIKEQPEDLGKPGYDRIPGHQPASMWQFPQFWELLEDPDAKTVVFPQSAFGTPSVKPTRFVMKLDAELHPSMRVGPPLHDANGYYVGPLEKLTGVPLIGKQNGQFRTAQAAAWPPKLCHWAATSIISAYMKYRGGAGAEKMKRKRKQQDHEEDPAEDPGMEKRGEKKRKAGEGEKDEEGSNPFDPKEKGGVGLPRSCCWKGNRVPFHDGGGLPSPGRWPVEARSYPGDPRWSEFRRRILEAAVEKLGSLQEVEKEAFRMTRGGDRFSLVKDEGYLGQIREAAKELFGLDKGEMEVPQGQPFRLPLMRRILEEAGDCDAQFLKDAETGFSLGVLFPMPRTPGVFERQTTWSLDEFEKDVWAFEKPNYPSAGEHEEHLRSHLEAEVEEGLVDKMSEEAFVKKFGDNRAIAALAVLVEDETLGKKRVIHDGTHEIGVNNRIRCQDKIRMPGPREKRTLLEEFKAAKKTVISLVGDFEKAHRRFLYREEERGFLGCRVSADDEVIYVNRVGTFGVGSTPYWWARLSGALIRLTHYVLGPELPLEMLLYADDLEVMAAGKQSRVAAVLAFAVMAAMGAPFKWKKQRGGFVTEWVGLTTDYVRFAMGLSEKRSMWVTRWIDGVLERMEVGDREFAAALGRLSFASLALPWERPFLGPLFAWSAAIRGQKGKMIVPWAIQFILKWIRRKLQEGMRLEEVQTEQGGAKHLRFWTDAGADENTAWIGGWKESSEDLKQCEWFSFEVTEEMAPWLKSRDGNPKRVIAALELLATIVAMKIWMGDVAEDIQVYTEAFTDNLGNSFILKRGLSTKYPLTLLLMEVSEMLRVRGSNARLNWVKRDNNVPADDLTNENYEKFSEDLRRWLPGGKIQWLVFDKLNQESQELYNQITALKVSKRKAVPLPVGGDQKVKRGKFFKRWSS